MQSAFKILILYKHLCCALLSRKGFTRLHRSTSAVDFLLSVGCETMSGWYLIRSSCVASEPSDRRVCNFYLNFNPPYAQPRSHVVSPPTISNLPSHATTHDYEKFKSNFCGRRLIDQRLSNGI